MPLVSMYYRILMDEPSVGGSYVRILLLLYRRQYLTYTCGMVAMLSLEVLSLVLHGI